MTEDEPKAKAGALCLDQFLKLNSIAESGGHAKVMIQSGEVKVNGAVETRRRKKLQNGDVIEVAAHESLEGEQVEEIVGEWLD